MSRGFDAICESRYLMDILRKKGVKRTSSTRFEPVSRYHNDRILTMEIMPECSMGDLKEDDVACEGKAASTLSLTR